MGTWELAFELGRDPITQKRVRRTISFKGNQKDAEQALTAALAQRDRGIDLAPDKVTVGEYLPRWLRDYARPNVGPSTYERYAGIVANHFNPAFGSLALSKLRPAHLQAAYALWIEKGLSAKTVVHHHRLIHEALGHAVDWQLLALNPATAAKPPRPAKAPITFLEPEEYARLRAAAERKEPNATL